MAAKGFLDKHPNPTLEQCEKGLSGNLCRCGTYVGMKKAVLEAAKQYERRKPWLILQTIPGRRWTSGR